MTIKGTQVTINDGSQVTSDLIVRGSSEDLCDNFWGNANPASSYIQGAIKVQGSQENMKRLDAMAMLILFKRVGKTMQLAEDLYYLPLTHLLGPTSYKEGRDG